MKKIDEIERIKKNLKAIKMTNEKLAEILNEMGFRSQNDFKYTRSNVSNYLNVDLAWAEFEHQVAAAMEYYLIKLQNTIKE